MEKTIMIVDDSPTIRQVVSTALQRAGYAVLEAADGADAITKLQGKIHLIVCDLNMPNLDGLSFVRRMREMPEFKFIPVVMLTTESQTDRKLEGRQAGVRAWMVKPFKTDKLLGLVEKMVLP
jgi:two-component system chemotaxis response regulator CheY